MMMTIQVTASAFASDDHRSGFRKSRACIPRTAAQVYNTATEGIDLHLKPPLRQGDGVCKRGEVNCSFRNDHTTIRETLTGYSMTATLVVEAETPQQSAQAVLHGHQALTPIIAGSISGSGVVLIWLAMLFVWLRNRRGRRARIDAEAEAEASRLTRRYERAMMMQRDSAEEYEGDNDNELETPGHTNGNGYFIPRDPAIAQGHQPGEKAQLPPKQNRHRRHISKHYDQTRCDDGKQEKTSDQDTGTPSI